MFETVTQSEMGGRKTGYSKHLVLLLLSAAVPAFCQAYGETFSFAVIADPHVSGNADNRAKFETAVDWIISNKESKDIELTFVLGDIAWGGPKGGRNLRTAKKYSTASKKTESLTFPL